jgi:hypothetical protein
LPSGFSGGRRYFIRESDGMIRAAFGQESLILNREITKSPLYPSALTNYQFTKSPDHKISD